MAPRRVPGRVVAGARQHAAKLKLDGQQKLVFALWIIELFCPHFFLAEVVGLRPLLRVPLALIIWAGLWMLMKSSKGDWIPGVALWVAYMGLTMPFAFNREMAILYFRLIISFYIVGLTAVRAIKSPRTASPLIYMVCVLQFAFWGVLGAKNGAVLWHPSLANPDGFGPAMAVGVGPAYFYSTAVQDKKRKRIALFAAGVCIIGVASAFARGAVLCLVATIAYIWFRSPRKGRTFGMILAGGVVLTIAASFVDGKSRDPTAQSNFFSEMMTVFNPSEDDTGNDRKVLWSLAMRVFYANPVFGAGTESFGVGAVKLYEAGKLGVVGGDYALNPVTLYERALHNIYYQILSENGIVGFAIFWFVIVNFWKRNRKLRDPQAVAKWYALGGREDIGRISLGLECGIVGFLTTGYFYNQLSDVWLWFIVFINAIMYSIVVGTGKTAAAAPRRARPPMPAAPPTAARVPGQSATA